MKVCVVGLGYIGTPTAVTLASSGYNVYGYDINEETVRRVREKNVPINEYGLHDALSEVIDNGKLTVGTEIKEADIFVVAVSTPPDPETKKINLEYLKSAVKDISTVLREDNLVIIESTVIPGTTRNVVKPILDSAGVKYHLAFCPERVLPGNLMHELIHNDRIIGGTDEKSAELAREFYSRFVKGHLHVTDDLTAELAKLMENTYRAVNIALANEMAFIAEELGADVWKAIEMANNHPRVNIHLPGPGVGGYCLTKDPYFLIENYGKSKVISVSMEINNSMPDHVVSLVEKHLDGVKGKKIAVFGIAYKADVSDPRESPGYEVLKRLADRGAEVRAHDPHVEEYMGMVPERDIAPILDWADCVVIATDHKEYRHVEWENYKGLIVDTKNLVRGGNVVCLGRGTQ